MHGESGAYVQGPYTQNLFYVWSFSHILFVSQKMYFTNSGTLSSLRLKKIWGGELILVDLLKRTLLHIFFYICRMGLHLGFLYADPLLCYYFDAGAYIRWGIYSEFYGTVK